jgi:hypothetical protein
LREVHIAQRGDHLDFDDDLVLNKEVGATFVNDHVVIKDRASRCCTGAQLLFRPFGAARTVRPKTV